MLLDNLSNTVSVTAIAILILGGSVYLALERWRQRKSQRAFQQTHGCTPSTHIYPNWDPIIGIDFAVKLIKAARKRQLMKHFTNNFKAHGDTYVVSSLRGLAIHTTEPENVKAAFAVHFNDWSVGPARKAFKLMLGDSTFVSDGPRWVHSRAILRPTFVKEQVADLSMCEKYLQAMLRLIPTDGSTVELAGLFNRLTFDVSTHFLFGQAIGSLETQVDSLAQLSSDIDLTMQDAADRARYLILYPFLKRKGVSQALKRFHAAADTCVKAALDRAAQEKASADLVDKPEKYSFLDELARQDTDPRDMRYEAIGMLFAGRDTTATLLSNLWFLLARHPHVWTKLQTEIDELQGQPPTYDWLKTCKYLKYCEHETMRLLPVTPILPPRTANKDTVLPLGGGLDGKSPLFVPKGARLLANIYASNRRQEVFGPEPESFIPERWENLRPGWSYTPFSGGPRICIGQQFALTEVYYITVRLMQQFRRIELRDDEPFVENIAGVTLTTNNGVLVGLYPD